MCAVLPVPQALQYSLAPQLLWLVQDGGGVETHDPLEQVPEEHEHEESVQVQDCEVDGLLPVQFDSATVVPSLLWQVTVLVCVPDPPQAVAEQEP